MQNTPPIPPSKIILLVAVAFIAIMTSVMIYHAHYQTQVKSVDEDEALLFPVAHELKDFNLRTAKDQLFSQADLKSHWTLLLFGFTRCASICPTTLTMINKVYAELQHDYPSLQVVLVSLDPDRDTPAHVAAYAQSFNPAFIGTTGTLADLRKLQSQFGVYSARTPESNDNYQLQHTASIMLINPQGQWAGMFKFGLSPAEFKRVFNDSVRRAK